MNGEIINTNINSGENSGNLPQETLQEVGRKTYEVVEAEELRSALSKMARPDQIYAREYSQSESYEQTLSALGESENVAKKIRILNWADGNTGDERIEMNKFLIGRVLDAYPTVYDFEEAKVQFRDISGDSKLVEAADDIFGKDVVKELEMDIYGKEQVDFLETWRNSKGGNYENIEEEKLFDSVSAFMLSKDQVANIEPARGSQDTAYAENGLFAVFDGVGGSEDGQGASQLCARNIENIVGQVDFTSDYGKKFVIGALNYTLKEAGTRGSTTSVITKLVQGDDGKRMLHYVSVGDSRLYVVRKDGTAEQVTHDDAMTDDQIMTVLNSRGGNKKLSDMAMRYARAGSEEAKQALLAGSPMRKDLVEDMARLARQCMDHGISKSLHGGSDIEISEGNMGSIELNKGDQLVLCSDGITGDVAADRMSNEDLARAVHGFSSDEAVANLMQRAKKIDDRTAIVVNI